MDWKKSARLILLLGAIVMLSYQSHKAVVLILAPPMMMTATQVDISGVPLPMMYICPLNQYNESKLNKNMFDNEADILMGKSQNSTKISWGSHVNKTFEELIGNMTDTLLDDFVANLKNESDPKLHVKTVMFPKYGFCFDVQNYNTVEMLMLPRGKDFNSNITILLTDRQTKTYFSVDRLSQEGDKMILNTPSVYAYYVTVEMHVKSDSEKCNPEPDYSYEKCVNDFVLNDLEPELGCIPPFLSNNNHCKSFDETYEDKLRSLYIEQYTSPYMTSGETKAEKKCPKPCVQQLIKVVHRDTTPLTGKNGPQASITFNQVVKKFKA